MGLMDLSKKRNSHVAHRNSDARGNRKHGPATSEEVADTGISEGFLCDLALKHVAMLPEPTTQAVRTYQSSTHINRRSASEVISRKADRSEEAVGDWFDALRDVGPRLGSSDASFVDVRLCWTSTRISARLLPHDEAVDTVKHGVDGHCAPGVSRSGAAGIAASDVGLRHQFTTFALSNRLPGTGKTAVAERINGALAGGIWIPYAVEIDGQIIRVFDLTVMKMPADETHEFDHRWVLIQRPLVVVGGELTLGERGPDVE